MKFPSSPSPSEFESSSSAVAKGLSPFPGSGSPDCVPFDKGAFCLECSARRAASWRRAREGGMLSGGGGGGGAEGGPPLDSRSLIEVVVKVVVDGVEM